MTPLQIRKTSQMCPEFEELLSTLLKSGWDELARPSFILKSENIHYFIHYLAVKDNVVLLACCKRMLPNEILPVMETLNVDNPNFMCLFQTYAGFDVGIKSEYSSEFLVVDMYKCKFLVENS